MRKNLKSWLPILAILVTVGLGYQSLIGKVVGNSIDWIRHLDSSYGEPGYHLHSQHPWETCNDAPSLVYVFESDDVGTSGSKAVLVVVKDHQHCETDRIVVPGGHRLVKSSVLGKDGNYLELVIQVTPGNLGLCCEYVNLATGVNFRDAAKITFSRHSPPHSRVENALAQF